MRKENACEITYTRHTTRRVLVVARRALRLSLLCVCVRVQYRVIFSVIITHVARRRFVDISFTVACIPEQNDTHRNALQPFLRTHARFVRASYFPTEQTQMWKCAHINVSLRSSCWLFVVHLHECVCVRIGINFTLLFSITSITR